MRELHAWHGDRRHAPDATADTLASRGHDAPRHAVLRDPAERIAKHLEYQKVVAAAETEYAARHRKLDGARPEHTPLEARDRPASKIAGRWDRPETQEQTQRKPERSRLPSNEATQAAAGASIFISSVIEAAGLLPGRWDAVAASFLGAVVAGVAWGNKRWKDRHGHGHRPED